MYAKQEKILNKGLLETKGLVAKALAVLKEHLSI